MIILIVFVMLLLIPGVGFFVKMKYEMLKMLP